MKKLNYKKIMYWIGLIASVLGILLISIKSNNYHLIVLSLGLGVCVYALTGIENSDIKDKVNELERKLETTEKGK